MRNLKFQKKQINGFVGILTKERNGRMHNRRRVAPGEAVFVTANVDETGGLFGRVTGPNKRHAKYSIGVNRAIGAIDIAIDLEAPNGNFSVDQAYREVVFAFEKMMKSPHKPEFKEGQNKTRWQGYYLRSTGRNKVGKLGLQTLARAVREKQISNEFKNHCVQEGFTMEYHPLKI